LRNSQTLHNGLLISIQEDLYFQLITIFS
jgi:hypothetical protein